MLGVITSPPPSKLHACAAWSSGNTPVGTTNRPSSPLDIRPTLPEEGSPRSAATAFPGGSLTRGTWRHSRRISLDRRYWNLPRKKGSEARRNPPARVFLSSCDKTQYKNQNPETNTLQLMFFSAPNQTVKQATLNFQKFASKWLDDWMEPARDWSAI